MRNFFGPTRRPNLDPTSVDLRWLGGRTWAEVAFGLPPVAGRTNRLKITRVVLAALAQWIMFRQLVRIFLVVNITYDEAGPLAAATTI